MNVEIVPFAEVRAACAKQGLTALATMKMPEKCDASGLDRMLADGVGDMTWLAKTRLMRLQPSILLPSGRSMLIVALPYQSDAGSEALKRARYAAGKDYHSLLRTKLARVGDEITERFKANWLSRACVDSAPLNERSLAHQAGLGWLGKNGLLISPESGSFHLLGFLLTEAPLEFRHGGHGTDRCGSCMSCEQRCPTRALVGRRVLSERCISYLTIEHHGVITKTLAEKFQGWWFGCDLCQEACPWNRFAPEAGDPRLTGSDRDQELLAVGETSFDEFFAGRAIRRIGYERFRRNLLIALWSLGRHAECRPFLDEGLPLVLRQAAELGLVAPSPSATP